MTHIPRSTAIVAALVTITLGTPTLACQGCGCAGGPGYRMPSGRCASWAQFKSNCNGACFPAGTSDERGGLMLRVPPPVGLDSAGKTPASGPAIVTPK